MKRKPQKECAEDQSLLDELSALRATALRSTPFIKPRGQKLQSLVKKSCKRRLAESQKSSGKMDVIYRQKKVSAALTLYLDSESVPGIKFPHLTIDLNAKGTAAIADAKILVDRNASLYTNKTVSFVLASQPRLREILEKTGFAVESIVLFGPVAEGLKSLVKKINPPRNLKHLGFEIKKIASPENVQSVMKLYKSEFRRNPQFGLWASDKKYLQQMKQSMEAELARNKLNGFVICKRSKVLGYFGYYISRINPMYPSGAGVEIVLDKSIQGQGIAKTCYRFMLERLRRSNIVMIRGATSQPAVMGLGKILKREPFAYLMRYQSTYFEKSHFSL